jgi:hypothetical protein
VRGASLRDFYAKSVALAGLAVLAGLGALVDYWPAQLDVPQVASVIVRPAAPATRGIPAAPPVRLALDTVTHASPVRRASRPVVRPAFLVTAAPDHLAGMTVAVPMPAAPEPSSLDVTSIAMPTIAAEPVGLSEPAATVPGQAVALAAFVPEAPPADSSDGFLTGALKKTGSSIITVGVKTGTTIVDAIGLVGHVMMKLKFF